jgi:hypothetical protein
MTKSVHRITTDYVETEDRLRLRGETEDGERMIIWLTQRLLNRVIPHLCQWLEGNDRPPAEQSSSPGLADVAQSMAQQAAQQRFASEAPVEVDLTTRSWRAEAVDIATALAALRITFRSGAGDSASLTLRPEAMRQWLGIVHGQYKKGEWPMSIWPEWLEEAGGQSGWPPGPLMLH